MGVYIATKTLTAIEEAIHADQGAAFRGWMERVMPHIGDAYSTDTFPFRSHMGASLIGSKCARQIWYGFRWSKLVRHTGRLLRLFNRGHAEEARFIAMLLTIGCEVIQQDEHGNQFRISDAGGHFGGSGDGIVVNCPDLPPGQAALCEFKTSADKPFKKLQKEGVKAAKWEHYVQMNTYMRKMGFAAALYMAVNKNNDELYAEIVFFDPSVADEYIERGCILVATDREPEKMKRASATYFECKWCDYNDICHSGAVPLANCRTCEFVHCDNVNGGWHCNHPNHPVGNLDKHQQLAGCPDYERLF